MVGARKVLTGWGMRWSMLVASLAGVAAMLRLIQLIGLMGHFNFTQGLGWIRLRSPIVELIFFMGSTLGLTRDFGETALPFRAVNIIIAGAGLWRRWTRRINQTDWSVPLLIMLVVLPNLILLAVTHTLKPIYLV